MPDAHVVVVATIIIRVPDVHELPAHVCAEEASDTGVVKGLSFQAPKIRLSVAIRRVKPCDGVRVTTRVACKRLDVSPGVFGEKKGAHSVSFFSIPTVDYSFGSGWFSLVSVWFERGCARGFSPKLPLFKGWENL